MFAPVELFEKYAPKRITGYCTQDDPCSEITADSAAGAHGALARIAAVQRRCGSSGSPACDVRRQQRSCDSLGRRRGKSCRLATLRH